MRNRWAPPLYALLALALAASSPIAAAAEEGHGHGRGHSSEGRGHSDDHRFSRDQGGRGSGGRDYDARRSGPCVGSKRSSYTRSRVSKWSARTR